MSLTPTPTLTRTLLGAAAVALLVAACGAPEPAKETAPAATAAPAQQSPVDRGRYLAEFGGCDDCHTPMVMGPRGPAPDMSKRLSGHPAAVTMPTVKLPAAPWGWYGAATNTAFAGPWGVSYAANLTPDADTGLGRWSDADFMKSMRTGTHLAAPQRPILPPMPWADVAKLNDDDLKAVFAFLKTLPPVVNAVPDATVAPQ